VIHTLKIHKRGRSTIIGQYIVILIAMLIVINQLVIRLMLRFDQSMIQ